MTKWRKLESYECDTGPNSAQDMWLDAKQKLWKPYQISNILGIVFNFLHFVMNRVKAITRESRTLPILGLDLGSLESMETQAVTTIIKVWIGLGKISTECCTLKCMTEQRISRIGVDFHLVSQTCTCMTKWRIDLDLDLYKIYDCHCDIVRNFLPGFEHFYFQSYT